MPSSAFKSQKTISALRLATATAVTALALTTIACPEKLLFSLSQCRQFLCRQCIGYTSALTENITYNFAQPNTRIELALEAQSKLTREQKHAALARLNSNELIEKAILNYSLGNFKACLELLDFLLLTPSSDAQESLLKLRGLCLENLHRYPQALKQYSDSLMTRAQNVENLKARARVYIQLNKGDLALADLEKALSVSTSAQASEISVLLAKMLFEQNHKAQAIKLLQDNCQSAMKITDHDKRPLSSPLASLDLLASIYVIEGKYSEALHILNIEMKLASEKLGSTYSSVWRKQAWLLAFNKNEQASNATLASLATLTKKNSEKLATQYSQDWHEWQKLAEAFIYLKRPLEEKICRQHIVSLTEGELTATTPDLESLRALIQAYDATAQVAEAKVARALFYKQVEGLAKLYGDPGYQFLWGEELAYQGLASEALAHFKSAIALAPENILYRRRCSEILLSRKDFGQTQLITDLITGGNDAALLALSAAAHQELGDLSGAQNKLSAAQRLDCLEPAIYNELAKLNARQGKPDLSQKNKIVSSYLLLLAP